MITHLPPTPFLTVAIAGSTSTPSVSTHLYTSKDAKYECLQCSAYVFRLQETGQHSYRARCKCGGVDAPEINWWQRIFGGYIFQPPHFSAGATLRYVLHSLPELLGRKSTSCLKWWLASSYTLYWPLPSLCPFLTPRQMLPSVTSPKYHSYLTPCFRVCLWTA